MIHSVQQLGFVLHDREEAENVIVQVFKRRQDTFKKRPLPPDRTEYPLVVCSGMKGLGKTRMLEEWERLFECAGIPEPRMGVFVMYGNGHSPQPFEENMPIQAAFSWRLLHHLFVENNTGKPEVADWSTWVSAV
eukprot:Lithocolla_globosa_v1_NODE_7983_length_878_cov_2.599028.p1 type:complete len:134 gc:universal NODE_7983_length_878_cov_2.599028:314-715(+)